MTDPLTPTLFIVPGDPTERLRIDCAACAGEGRVLANGVHPNSPCAYEVACEACGGLGQVDAECASCWEPLYCGAAYQGTVEYRDVVTGRDVRTTVFTCMDPACVAERFGADAQVEVGTTQNDSGCSGLLLDGVERHALSERQAASVREQQTEAAVIAAE